LKLQVFDNTLGLENCNFRKRLGLVILWRVKDKDKHEEEEGRKAKDVFVCKNWITYSQASAQYKTK